MNFVTINETALFQAATAIVGADATNAILSLYQLLDKATADGYQLGQHVATQDVEKKLDAAFDSGYEQGFDQGETATEEALDEAGDDGYVQGVSDARRRPAVADRIVQNIIAGQVQDEFDDGGPYNEDNVQDSGDENDCRICGGVCADDTAC